MMSNSVISIFANNNEMSADVKSSLAKSLIDRGYTVMSEFCDMTKLIVCVGGDGSLLETIHACGFPEVPIVGINTGHLGFFQEFCPDSLESFIESYESGQYSIQKLGMVKCSVKTEDGLQYTHHGLNEITVTGRKSYSVHFDILIDDVLIEHFSGDGILVATSAGSTAYNYSLGGSIVDPRLNLLQITPIAPMNTTAFRSFTSSILIPSDLKLGLIPEVANNHIYVTYDGIETGYSDVKELNISASDKYVNLIRFSNYDFWSKVKDKFL